MPNARKPHSDFAGYVAELRNKLSGGHNVICDCKRAEFEGNPWVADYKMEGGRYRVLCDTHSTLVYCTNLPAARSCMKDATEFCDLCRVIAGQISIDNAGLTVEDKAKVLDRIAQRDGLTFGNLTAETAERIGFDAAPPSLADDVQAIRALLVDAPPETPDTTPEALRHGPDAGLTDELYVTDVESEAHQLVSQLAASLIRATVKAGNPTRTPFYAVYVSPDASDRARVVRARLFESWHVGHIQTFAALPSETTEDK